MGDARRIGPKGDLAMFHADDERAAETARLNDLARTNRKV